MTDVNTQYQVAQAEAYCNHIRGLRLRLETANGNLREAAIAADGLKAVAYDKEGGGYVAHGDDAIAGIIERLDATRDRAVQKMNEWVGECEQFDAICERLTPMSAALLARRYRNAMRWDDVARELGDYRSEYVRGILRERALAELYMVMPMRWK